MGLFGSKLSQHLTDHKDSTKHEAPISMLTKELSPKEVYFPSMAPNGKPITFTVKAGDAVKVGTKIGQRTDFYVPVYSSVSGTVKANKMVFSPQIGRPIQHLIIENDANYEKENSFKTVTLDNSAEEIMAAIKEAGITGMGGAGFPTYVKYENVKGIDTILANGVECEPYLTTDYVTLKNSAKELVEGLKLCLKVTGAAKAIICFKEGKEEVKEAVTAALANESSISYAEVPDKYPLGFERVLIRHVLKREYDKLPSEAHVIVDNVQTIIELAKTCIHGEVTATRLVTVSGDGINKNANILCPVGTLAKELIAVCGGYIEGDIDLIPGGPMCGKAIKQDDFPILLPNGGITVIKYHSFNTVGCLRCGACIDNCPMNLQPVELKISFDRKDTDRMEKFNIMKCVECGLCSYVCPSHIDVTDAIKKAKMLYKLKKK